MPLKVILQKINDLMGSFLKSLLGNAGASKMSILYDTQREGHPELIKQNCNISIKHFEKRLKDIETTFKTKDIPIL